MVSAYDFVGVSQSKVMTIFVENSRRHEHLTLKDGMCLINSCIGKADLYQSRKKGPTAQYT